MDRRGSGRASRIVVALAAAAVVLLAPPAATPAAAAEELRLTVAATYTLDPADRTVHVVMDVTATNLKPDTVRGSVITSYFYNELSFAIQEEATAIRATSGGRRLSASTARRERFKILTVRLASNLDHRETQRVRITFDLPGGAPRSASNIRVGDAFASFYAWAWGDPGRSSVAIVVPAGFDETVTGARLAKVANSTATRLTATAIADPDTWFVTVDAQRPARLTRDMLAIAGARLTIRAWPEDAEWREKVRDLLERGLPILQRNIGLDWPVDGDVEIFEVHTPLLEGYAGVYYTESDRIEIGEDLDDLTILHEASHAWFNGDLLAGRWIAEGLADEYASIVLDELGLERSMPEAVTPSSQGAVRLNAWEHPGRIDDEDTDRREAFGYNASWTVLRDLLDEIGIDGMRNVIQAADAREIAYRGESEPEAFVGVNDWRRFLDLLEEVAASDTAEPLFRRWVTEPHQDELLDDRAAARAAYAALLDAGDGWSAPYAIRSKLAVWDFARATAVIDEAERVLATRESIEARAARLEIAPTTTLETTYESARVDLEQAAELADRQLATLDGLAAARAALDREHDIVTSIGLVGSEPEAEYDAAIAAFREDRLDAADADAAEARALVDGAADVGRTRVAGAAGATGMALLVGGGLVIVVRRRRPRRTDAPGATFDAAPTSVWVRPAGTAAPPAPRWTPSPDGTALEETRPYATLPPPPPASPPDAPPAGERGEDGR